MITRFLAVILRALGKKIYSQDGLITVHNHDFLDDPHFQSAYRRGVKAGNVDYRFHWRVHVALWAAECASRIPGDFVECGVNKGFVSSAILHSLDWDELNKTYYLLDTFNGPAEELLSSAERAAGYVLRNEAAARTGFYANAVEGVEENFREWSRVRIVQGTVPHTLSKVEATAVSFLHIDMNCSEPEVAALDFFWDRLSPGAIVLLDDYAYVGFSLSKRGMDLLGEKRGFRVLSLPTGQGLILKTT